MLKFAKVAPPSLIVENLVDSDKVALSQSQHISGIKISITILNFTHIQSDFLLPVNKFNKIKLQNFAMK